MRRRIALALLTAWLFCAAALFLLPTVLTLTNSFMSTEEISAGYGVVYASAPGSGSGYMAQQVHLKFIPDMVSLGQYSAILFESPEYLMKFWNSVILVAPIVLGQTAVAALAAYGFSIYRGRGRELLFFAYIILMLMPYQVTLVPNYLVAKFLGMLDTRRAVILPGIFTPFAVFLLTKTMRRIPKEIREAAQLDGAGQWKIFTRVYLPQCRSALYSVVILVFIDNWNMVEQVLVLLTDPDEQPLSVFLSQINAGEIGLAFAAAAVYMIPAILLFLHGEGYLVEGIADQGSLKG